MLRGGGLELGKRVGSGVVGDGKVERGLAVEVVLKKVCFLKISAWSEFS